eukprot:1404687-Rhodomonas_salina.6
MLFGGDGLVTTGDYVDGRRTTPGLHTNCIPGVLRSDCSPAQEDGAWSTEAAKYIDDHTGKLLKPRQLCEVSTDTATGGARRRALPHDGGRSEEREQSVCCQGRVPQGVPAGLAQLQQAVGTCHGLQRQHRRSVRRGNLRHHSSPLGS